MTQYTESCIVVGMETLTTPDPASPGGAEPAETAESTETATLTHSAALARFGHALSDPTRARILLALRRGPACPSDLAEMLGVSRQVMSNQLACLRGCGVVEAAPEGRRTWYRLADARLTAALSDLLDLTLAVDPTCCCAEGECTC